MRRYRGTTTARGYGRAHQEIRAQFVPLVASGLARCARCGERIKPGEAFDLDHTDDRSGYLGPSHRFAAHCPAGGNRNTRGLRVRSQVW